MEILFLLLAAMAMPVMSSGDDEDNGAPDPESPDPDTPEVTLMRGADGALMMQADASDSELDQDDLRLYLSEQGELTAAEDGSIGFDAGAGDDTIRITAQFDMPFLNGGDGNDELSIGSAGDATLDGGAGDDTLALDFRSFDLEDEYDGETESGDPLDMNAVMTGGSGADTFEIEGLFSDVEGGHRDGEAQLVTITDFEPGQDSLLLQFDAADWPGTLYDEIAFDGATLEESTNTMTLGFTLSGTDDAGTDVSRVLSIDVVGSGTMLDTDEVELIEIETGFGLVFSSTDISEGLSATTNENGDPFIQAGDEDDDLTFFEIESFITATPELASAEDGSIGIALGAGDDILDIRNIETPLVQGQAGDDQIWGGNDTQDGPLTVEGGEGDDSLFASMADQLGGAGDDLITGHGAADNSVTLDGGEGNDFVNSWGHTLVFGGSGDDQILALSGNATVEGGAGNDTLEGGGAGIVLSGGAGDDTLTFEAVIQDNRSFEYGQNAVLTGGAGADSFTLSDEVFYVEESSDASSVERYSTITDFDPLEDSLLIELDVADGPAYASNAFSEDMEIALTGVSGDGFTDIEFTITGENDGTEVSRDFVVRLEGVDVDATAFDVVSTDAGIALSLNPSAAA